MTKPFATHQRITVTYTWSADWSLDPSNEEHYQSREKAMKWVEEQVMSYRFRDEGFRETVTQEDLFLEDENDAHY